MQISLLKKKYPKFKIGYSDHAFGIDASTTAISLGAVIVEKHFTINKKSSKFRDHQLSADTSDMKELVKKSKIINDLLKKTQFNKTDQHKNINNFRRFIKLKKKSIIKTR